jgi:adenosylhomocysteine nucleosidase
MVGNELLRMELFGEISSDRPLVVLAVKEEAEYLNSDLPVLLTGIGKVNAAIALVTVLARPPRPSLVVNMGSAGALRPGWTGTHLVSTVIQHDLDSDVLRSLTGQSYGEPLTLPDTEGAVLATGDSFIADTAARDRLAAHASLVDMEGYAVAAAAAAAGVPVRIVKHVSDDADEGAARTWRQSVSACAQALAHWAKTSL